MASIYKMNHGKWRAQVFVKGKRASAVLKTKGEAIKWAAQFCKTERAKLEAIERGEPVPEDWEADIRVVKFADWQIMDQSTLFERDDILAKATPKQPVCGVYFLIQVDEIVYVGQSINVASRLEQHVTDGRKFDKVSVIACDAKALTPIERHYIQKFRPKLNIAGVN